MSESETKFPKPSTKKSRSPGYPKDNKETHLRIDSDKNRPSDEMNSLLSSNKFNYNSRGNITIASQSSAARRNSNQANLTAS